MKSITLAVLLGLASLAGAQEQAAKPTAEKRDSRVLILKHADPHQVCNLLKVFDVAAVPSGELRAISVSGSPESVTAYEEAVRRLDVPPPPLKNLELTAYILEASQQPEAAALPPELESVAKQLKSVFGYQGLRLLDTAVIRTREGHPASARGQMPYGSAQAARYRLDFHPIRLTGERLLRVDGLMMSVGDASLFNTTLDFKEGQKVVVGKSGIEGSQKALILVITGKAAE
ncbi:MAG: hypothetical protein FJW34_08790 [Acidobacteria bacterium]|nr:hypothetical protein [Acidobacteriota bacterium]